MSTHLVAKLEAKMWKPGAPRSEICVRQRIQTLQSDRLSNLHTYGRSKAGKEPQKSKNTWRIKNHPSVPAPYKLARSNE